MAASSLVASLFSSVTFSWSCPFLTSLSVSTSPSHLHLSYSPTLCYYLQDLAASLSFSPTRCELGKDRSETPTHIMELSPTEMWALPVDTSHTPLKRWPLPEFREPARGQGDWFHRGFLSRWGSEPPSYSQVLLGWLNSLTLLSVKFNCKQEEKQVANCGQPFCSPNLMEAVLGHALLDAAAVGGGVITVCVT